MKRSDNQNEIAPAKQQNLPDREIVSAPTSGKTEFLVGRPRPAHFSDSSPILPTWLGAAADTHRATALDSADAVAQVKTPTIDRLERLMTDEVRVIKQLKPDALAVVLKPDGETEILVQVHLRNGQVEAHARCERGDFDTLNAQWGQLQESMAGQGVRLMPLTEAMTTTSFTTSNGNGNSNTSLDSQTGGRSGQSPRQPVEAQAEPKLVSTGSGRAKAGAEPKKTPAARSREWWA